jgi:hypothetical protein
LKKGRDSNPE